MKSEQVPSALTGYHFLKDSQIRISHNDAFWFVCLLITVNSFTLINVFHFQSCQLRQVLISTPFYKSVNRGLQRLIFLDVSNTMTMLQGWYPAALF